MHKQSLTMEIIEQDILYQCKRELLQASFILIISILPIAMMISICVEFSLGILISLVFIISSGYLLLIFAISGLGIMCDALNILLMLKKHRFHITTQKVVSSCDGVNIKGSAHLSVMFSKPYVLYFYNFGKYVIPYGKNYKWSQEYAMNAQGVYETALIGDEFYLVIINHNKIILAYNCKFFNLEE